MSSSLSLRSTSFLLASIKTFVKLVISLWNEHSVFYHTQISYTSLPFSSIWFLTTQLDKDWSTTFGSLKRNLKTAKCWTFGWHLKAPILQNLPKISIISCRVVSWIYVSLNCLACIFFPLGFNVLALNAFSNFWFFSFFLYFIQFFTIGGEGVILSITILVGEGHPAWHTAYTSSFFFSARTTLSKCPTWNTCREVKTTEKWAEMGGKHIGGVWHSYL